MKTKIPLFKIYWDENDVKAVSDAIKMGMNWAIGPRIEEFEKKIAAYIGTKYALAFNSGTSALHALMIAYGFGAGDEVIVPSFTFIATANAPLFVGARPVFAEIESETCGLDPEDVKKKITSRTKAIMPIHFGGCACKIRELRQIAKDRNLILIEDAAEALGAQIDDKKTGTFGDAAVISLCANKVITTGEGGVVVTDSREILEKMKLARSHGRLDTANYFTTSQYMDYIDLGYNFRMSNILAALGISQLKKIKKIIRARKQNAAYLSKKLEKIPQIITPSSPAGYSHVYQMFTILVKNGRAERDRLKDHLGRAGIMTKVFFDPVHLTGFYKKSSGYKIGDLPVTEMVSAQVLTLPMYPSLTRKEMDFIAKSISDFYSPAQKA